MTAIDIIIKKINAYARHQQLNDALAVCLMMVALGLIALSMALVFLRSPLYGLLGIAALLLYRPRSLIDNARRIETSIGLKGELVNSIQLAQIPQDNREHYSQELISAYITTTVQKVEHLDFTRYVNHTSLYRSLHILTISMIMSLLQPALIPQRFWYALNHRVYTSVAPGNVAYPEGTSLELTIHLDDVYVPSIAELSISENGAVTRYRIKVRDGVATKTIKLKNTLSYHFSFLDHVTDDYTVTMLKPLYIEILSFHYTYPRYTGLPDETRTGRQIIVPEGTKVHIEGKASQPLTAASFVALDTVALACDGKQFSGDFTVNQTCTALLNLTSYGTAHEQILVYSIPDLPPLVEIFYPGYDITLPQDMVADIGIRCSDDYGLDRAIFYYTFKDKNSKPLPLHRGRREDTLSFTWDLTNLGMLPGDEVSYYVEIEDNHGHASTSKTFRVSFPTMEEIYEEVSKEGERVEENLQDLQTEHKDELDEISRIQQKFMKEREMTWADQEKLKEVISKEQNLLDKIDEWKTEIEKTIEKLQEGIVLDQASIEHLQEISRILQEIAPDALRQALENMQAALDKQPQDMQKALEDVKKNQEQLAQALERTLELLRRYQQEEKLKELANLAQELAQKAVELDSVTKEIKDYDPTKEMDDLNKGIDTLIQNLKDLASSENLEEALRTALANLAQQGESISGTSSATLGDKEQRLTEMAGSLEQLYESLTSGRVAALRKNLLESLNQLIDISKAQEQLNQRNVPVDSVQQDDIIEATKVVAESLYAQQTKSLFVTPRMSEFLARALNSMERAEQLRKEGHSSKEAAHEAMESLNEVSRSILESLEQAAQGGSSTGMDQFMQSLAKIAQGQMSLNQSLSGILPLPVVGLTSTQKAQLQRLAGKQRALREALESLRADKGGQEYQDLLNAMIQEMQDIEQSLYQYKVDRTLIERQHMILSRLLDTQRSIRREDFDERRKSKPGEDIIVEERPQPLPENLGKDELRELLRNALKESYPPEYELYIRDYFKRLLEEQ